MDPGPTTGAQRRTSESWTGRPVVSFSLRALVFVAPIVASWTVTRACSGAFWRPAGPVGLVIWATQLLAVGSATVLLVGRASRKLLPLAALLNLALVFPDQAPSRFRVALRSGTIKNLQAQLTDVRHNGFGTTATETTTRIVELVTALGHHERLTRGHTERVRAYTDLLARELGVDDAERNTLLWATMLHDIGKLAVPADILNKPTALTSEEWTILSNHPVVGGELVEPLADWLGDWRFAASQHHERWDGAGYPNQLAGTQISLAGRIVAVADAYDVITSTRSYKKPMAPADAPQELVRCAGTQFDPVVVRAFLNLSLGERSRRTGAIGWMIELVRGVGNALTHAGQAVGGAAATATVASALVVGITVAPPDKTGNFEVAKVVSGIMSHQVASPTETVTVVPASSTTFPSGTATVPDSVVVTTAPSTTRRAPAPIVAVPTTSSPAPPPTTGAPAPPTTSPPTTSPPTTSPPTTSPPTTSPPSSPVAKNDSRQVQLGQTAEIAVLDNDTDPDNNIDPQTLSIVSAPERGTAYVSGGRVIYTAPATGLAADHLVYRICDTTGLCTTGNVTVAIVP